MWAEISYSIFQIYVDRRTQSALSAFSLLADVFPLTTEGILSAFDCNNYTRFPILFLKSSLFSSGPSSPVQAESEVIFKILNLNELF